MFEPSSNPTDTTNTDLTYQDMDTVYLAPTR